MPLPALALAGLVAGVAINSKLLEHNRRRVTSRRYITPKFGSIVCCEIYQELEHTGIWIADDVIIEFSNNGLVKAMSAERFLKGRSGGTIFVATKPNGDPFALQDCGNSALNCVYSFCEYDLFRNNCHSFVARCIGAHDTITTFTELHRLIETKSNSVISWDKVKV